MWQQRIGNIFPKISQSQRNPQMIIQSGTSPHPLHISSSILLLEYHTEIPRAGHSLRFSAVPWKLLSHVSEQGAWGAQVTLGHAGQYKPVSLLQSLGPVPYTEPSEEVPSPGSWKDVHSSQRGQEPFFRAGFTYIKKDKESKYGKLIFLSGREENNQF